MFYSNKNSLIRKVFGMRHLSYIATATVLMYASFCGAAQTKHVGEDLFIKNACASCHGSDGKMPIFSYYPSLAGQSKDYLNEQLQDIVSGKRSSHYSEQMRLVVDDLKLSKADANSIADWLSLQSTPAKAKHSAKSSTGAKKAIASANGKRLYKERGCSGCHGSTGNNPVLPNAPKLAANNSDYLLNQLQGFQTGERSGTIMSAILTGIPKSELEDIATWLGK